MNMMSSYRGYILRKESDGRVSVFSRDSGLWYEDSYEDAKASIDTRKDHEEGMVNRIADRFRKVMAEREESGR